MAQHWLQAGTSSARRWDSPVSSTAPQLSSPLAVAHAARLLPAQQPLRCEQRLRQRAKCECAAKAPHDAHASAHRQAAAPDHADYRRPAAVVHGSAERGFRRGEQRAHRRSSIPDGLHRFTLGPRSLLAVSAPACAPCACPPLPAMSYRPQLPGPCLRFITAHKSGLATRKRTLNQQKSLRFWTTTVISGSLGLSSTNISSLLYLIQFWKQLCFLEYFDSY